MTTVYTAHYRRLEVNKRIHDMQTVNYLLAFALTLSARAIILAAALPTGEALAEHAAPMAMTRSRKRCSSNAAARLACWRAAIVFGRTSLTTPGKPKGSGW